MSNYKIGDKFEIEIGEIYESDDIFCDGVDLYRIKGFKSLVFDENGLNRLKKAKLYDAEDLSEAIKEAYDKGYEEGVKNAEKAQAEKPKTVKASDLKVDTIVICYDDEMVSKQTKHFAGLLNGKMYAYIGSFSSNDKVAITPWETMTLEDGTVVLPE